MSRIKRFFRTTFISLRHRNYRVFYVGQLISNIGNWLTIVAMTLLILKLTHSGFAVGLMASCQFGPILLLSAWGGAIADSVDKRKTLLLTQILEMCQSIGLAIIAFMPHPPLAGVYLLAVAGGVLLAFDNPLRRSFVSEMVPKEDVTNAVVLYSTLVNVSRVFGPALAGLLVVTVGYGWGFMFDAVSYLAVIYSLWIMRPEELFRKPPKPQTKGAVRAGFRYVLAEPALRVNFIMLAAIGTFAYNFTVTLPLFVTKSLHGSEGLFTILYSVFSAGAVLSALFIAQRKLVRLHHVIVGAAALGASMLLLASTPSVFTAVATIFLVGVASILFMTATTTYVQVAVKPEMLGRVLALQTILLIGTTPLSGPFLGWLADKAGARVPIIIGGVVALLTALYGHYAVKRFSEA